VIRLAGVLAHERAHVEHGPNEELAYLAQLITLENLQARAVDIASVRRALDAVKRQKRGRPSDARDP
jgi:Zn-dependent protease with chaperone function